MNKHYLYDDVKNLKYWVHAILPLVYDDSLSYYEVLAKVSAKMNEVIEQLNKNSEQIDKVTEFTVTSIENLTQAFNNFQAAMLERQDNFEKKLLKDVADWEEQLMADIDEWEKQLKSEIDEWETTLKNEINTWETNFTETYNTWKNQLESDIAEWERQLKADNDKWKADTTDELNTWKSDTESALNEWKNETMQSLETWKSNTESDINSWKQEAENDIASWKEQAEQGLDTWKQQAQADITKWENDFQSKYDRWKSEFESTYNSWQSTFEQKYNTWQSTFEASYTEWKNGVDSDLAAWKTQADKDIETWESAAQGKLNEWKSATESDLNTWKSNTENELNEWKRNFEGENANWEADVQQDIEQKFEQLGEVYVAKTDVVQTTGQSTTQVMSQKAVTDSIENVKSLVDEDYVHKTDVVQATGQSTTQVMSQKAVTDELGKKANSTDVTSLSNRVDNISSELAGDYVAKSDIVSEWGNNTDKVVSQFMNKYSLSYKGYITTGKLSDIKEEGVYRIENISISDYPPYNSSGALINIVNWNASGNYTNHTPYVIIQIVYLYDTTNYKLLIRSLYASNDNIIESGGWANVLFDNNVVQTTGQNTTQVMSQKAVTDELNNKASAVAISQQDTLPTISGVNTYEASENFNDIANSIRAGIIYMKNKENPNFGAEIIVPYTNGRKYGVWYDTIQNNVRLPALKLAEQPDLDKANANITSLQNTLSTTQQQVNGLNNGVDSFVLKSTNIASRPDFSKGLQVTFNGFTSSRPADLPALPDTPTVYSANDFSNTLLSIPTMTNVIPTSGFLGTQFLLTNKREILTRQCEYDNDGSPTSISEWETSNPFVSKMFTQGQLTSNTFANLVTYGAGVYTLSNVDMNSFTDKPSDMVATDKDAMVVVIPYSYTGTNPKYYNNFWLYLMFNDHPQYVYKRYIHKGAYNAVPAATGVWYKSTSEIVR